MFRVQKTSQVEKLCEPWSGIGNVDATADSITESGYLTNSLTSFNIWWKNWMNFIISVSSSVKCWSKTFPHFLNTKTIITEADIKMTLKRIITEIIWKSGCS